MKRKIVRIDESKCNGCGLCIPSCEEGALQIIDGKARLVKDIYCDGLGNCLGTCPQDAILIEEREAEAFDEAAVEEHLEKQDTATEPPRKAPAAHAGGCPGAQAFSPMAGGCPGSAARGLTPQQAAPEADDEAPTPSRLGNWPLQLHLVPPNAPYFDNASLLIAADCTAFALPDFQKRLVSGKVVLIGCPKLDDTAPYKEKLISIFRDNAIRDVEVVHMEVPCCYGIRRLVTDALADAGEEIPLIITRVGLKGDIQERNAVAPAKATS